MSYPGMRWKGSPNDDITIALMVIIKEISGSVVMDGVDNNLFSRHNLDRFAKATCRAS